MLLLLCLPETSELYAGNVSDAAFLKPFPGNRDVEKKHPFTGVDMLSGKGRNVSEKSGSGESQFFSRAKLFFHVAGGGAEEERSVMPGGDFRKEICCA